MVEQVQSIKGEEKTKHDLQYLIDDSLTKRVERMVNNKFLSDVTFVVGPEKQRIYAHKMALVMVSEYFYAMFYGNFAEAKLDEIVLKDEDPKIFLTLLHLIYGAQVNIGDENIRDIYDHMRMYMLPSEYYEPLINYLKNQVVDQDSAWHIFTANHYFKFQPVDEVCMPYIQNNPLYYFKKIGLDELEEERVCKIVGLQEINCTDEQLFSAIQGCVSFETGAKESWNLVKEVKRKFFSHKLMVFADGIYVSDCNPGVLTFSLELTTIKPVSLYGMGVYLVPTYGNVTVNLFLKNHDGAYTEISKLTYEKRINPCLETVNLMFEEIVLVKNECYEFKLELKNNDGYVTTHHSNSKLIHGNFDITFSPFDSRKEYHAIPHFWVKHPECGLGTTHMPQLCCSF